MDGFQVNSPKPEKQGQYTTRKKGYTRAVESARAADFPSSGRKSYIYGEIDPKLHKMRSVVRRVGILITFLAIDGYFFVTHHIPTAYDCTFCMLYYAEVIDCWV
jgi:hypothetical protein